MAVVTRASLVVYSSTRATVGAPLCAGCGQVLPAFTPDDATALARAVGQRRRELLRRPDDVLDRRVGRAATARDLVGGADAAMTAAAEALGGPGDLVAAIGAAGGARWLEAGVPGPDGPMTAAGVVWLALHDAAHHLEDAELALAAADVGTRIDLRPPP